MILSHYCSLDSFLAILESRTIRLSVLDCTNDYMEGKWLAKVARDMLLRAGVTDAKVDRTLSILAHTPPDHQIAAFCLSQESDQLSQWRGYADDGQGVSIGFSRAYLEALCTKRFESGRGGFSLKKVLYADQEIEEEIKDPITHAISCIELGALDSPYTKGLFTELADLENNKAEHLRQFKRLALALTMLFMQAHDFKNPAFSEEKEWRVKALISGDDLKSIRFRARGAMLVPYVDMPLEGCELSPILEVVLGPRNASSLKHVDFLLQSCKFENVTVRKSTASYR